MLFYLIMPYLIILTGTHNRMVRGVLLISYIWQITVRGKSKSNLSSFLLLMIIYNLTNGKFRIFPVQCLFAPKAQKGITKG